MLIQSVLRARACELGVGADLPGWLEKVSLSLDRKIEVIQVGK